MTAPTAPGTIPTRKVVRIGAAVAAVLLVVVVMSRRGDGPKAGAVAAAPIVVQAKAEPATSTTSARLDPLAQLGVLSPTAAALVGPSYEARREVARRASELMTRTGGTQCSIVIGAAGTEGTWELSTQYSAAFPVVVMAGCPFPPVPASVPAPVTTAVKS